MNEKTKKIVAIVVVIFFAIAFIMPLMSIFVKAAPTQQQLNKELKEQQQKKSAISKEIKEIKEEKKDIIAEKKIIDTEVKVLEEDVDNINGGIVQDEQDIEVIKANLQAATIASDKQYETFKKRVRVMYEQGPSGYLDALLSAQNFTDFLNRFEIIKQIATYDKDMSNRLEQTRKSIDDSKLALEQKKQSKVVKVSSLRDKVSSLGKKQVQRDALINELTQTEKELVKTLKAVEAEEQQTRAELRSLMSSANTTKYTGGKMAWPAPGHTTITSPFGYRFHPVLKVNKLHTGVDVATPSGASIVAVNAGKVIKAGYNGAYGNHIIIDHGGGVATLYAHASSLSVSVGQQVTRGQQIMKAGSTGYSTGPHLHFEVIKGGEPVNPMGYY